ncbi:hypothetical protein JB92DRAFT_2953811 [Gautieria morchelliformis]|nr:hypothetical protein JB92DRAFT_2953811 [Gautieria morchelliformis]
MAEEEADDDAKGHDNPKQHNNALNNFVCAAFYGLMGVEERSEKLKDPILRGYWVPDMSSKTLTNDQLFRPNFNLTFGKQKRWHKDVAKQIKDKGLSFSRAYLNNAEVNALTIDMIIDRLGIVFKNARAKYKMRGKQQVEQDECEMTKRRTGRKLRKAKGRMKVRNLVAKLQSREYDWMFGVDYQSTDESEWEEVISEGSGDERPGRTTHIKSQNPWQSHPPRYRAAHVQELFALLDTHRIEDQTFDALTLYKT